MFKLILLDYSMNDISGPETALEITRRLAEFKTNNPEIVCQTPYICCLSAYSIREYRDMALANGMHYYALKPISFNSLRQLLT